MIKILDMNVSGTQKDVAPRQRSNRFPSIGDHIKVLLNKPGQPQDIPL